MPRNFQYDVFVTYAHADRARVHNLAERLKNAGLRVWLDDWIIKPGDDILLVIDRGLEASRALVVCLSQAALDSDYVTMEQHSTMFRAPSKSKNRRFIPLLLADCDDLPDNLRRFRIVDLRRDDETAFEELVSALTPDGKTKSPALPSKATPNPRRWLPPVPEKLLESHHTASKLKLDTEPVPRQAVQSNPPPGTRLCSVCYGEGRVPCGACEGRGKWLIGPRQLFLEQKSVRCFYCLGAGEKRCDTCFGKGRVEV